MRLSLANGPFARTTLLFAIASAGSHASPPIFPGLQTPIGEEPARALSADMNGDGELDLLFYWSRDRSISVAFGVGDGSFEPEIRSDIRLNGRIEIGEFNNDGIADIAHNDVATDEVYVRLGVGDGTFLPPTVYDVGRQPRSIASADFNHEMIRTFPF